MYYVAVLVSLVTAALAAKLCVGIVAWIRPRWLRRTVFWLVVIPSALIVCGLLFVPVSDDIYMRCSPSHAIAVAAPLLAFMLTLVGFAWFGFHDGDEPKVPRARAWKPARTALRLLGAAPLLLLAVFLFDWELRTQLRSLKAETLKDWENIEQPAVADDENAALSYLELQHWGDTLNAWDEQYSEVDVETIDFADEQMTRLIQECQPAFEIIRTGSTKAGFQLRTREYPDQFAEDESLLLLRRAVALFRINLLARARRADVSGAYDDVKVLQNVAIQLGQGVSDDGHFARAVARSLATDSVERLLRLDSSVPDDTLRGLIDEQHNPRRGMPQLFAWVEAEQVTKLCDTYLGSLSEKDQEDLMGQDVRRLPPAAKYMIFMMARLARARDDLAAARDCSDIYTSFASRYDDPTATSDALVEQLNYRFPLGTICRFDPRDLLYYSIVAMHTDQQLMNTMVAATLYQRQHGRYPDQVSDLVPGLLAAPPVCLTDGETLHMRPLGEGLVIYGSKDRRDIEEDFKEWGTVRPATAKTYLRCSVFLGEAFDLVYPAPTETEREPSDGFSGDSFLGEATDAPNSDE